VVVIGVDLERAMHNHALIRGIEAQEGTFLAALPPNARERLLADGVLLEVQGGMPIFATAEAMERTGIVLRGLARTHLSSGDGRRLSVRFARPGTMIGSLTEGRAALSVQAVIPCTVLELNVGTLRELIAEDGRVGRALIAEVARRLRDTYATLASNTFGSMRERVARHLLDLATEAEHTESLMVMVTQQGLADGVGTVREVVARVLREFRSEGLIATTKGCIEILDPDAIASVVGRSRSNDWFAIPAGG
jgi:cAMP-binding proteins - catabolite gene activator and regulatory subunit of cAMP-dependent protein kinases